MSEESLIYGCIVGVHGSISNWYGIYPLNKMVVDELPTEDIYPPLTRGIFTVPMDYGQPRSAFYRQQVIHFGASFNGLSEFWPSWLEKFEGLLRRLYWEEARLHLKIELCGSYKYHWQAKWEGNDVPWHRIPPQPSEQWTFEGGPRDFRLA